VRLAHSRATVVDVWLVIGMVRFQKRSLRDVVGKLDLEMPSSARGHHWRGLALYVVDDTTLRGARLDRQRRVPR